MVQQLDVEAFLARGQEVPTIDVRSPAEFEHAHIPGAINIPLLDNDERAEVGTLYVQQGREPAVQRGLEIVGPKMAGFLQQAKAIAETKQLNVLCWRGGMRSGTMAWVFELGQIECATLIGGYKAYRNAVLESFQRPQRVITLGGLTGCQKTEILHELAQLGEQVIDLEGLAHHKGSAFGGLGQAAPPSNMQFENELYAHWSRLDPERPVWLEDESKRIGSVQIPDQLYELKQAAPVLAVELPLEKRIDWLEQGYAVFPAPDLIEGVNKIRKRLGGLRAQEAIAAIEAGEMRRFIEIVLAYYDHYYGKSLQARSERVYPVVCEDIDPVANARALLERAKAVLEY